MLLTRTAVALAALMLAGCTAMSTLRSTAADTEINVQKKAIGKAPLKVELQTTTFGNYEFRAKRPDGKTMYGILPLKFNGGYLAANILFFAPASFWNLRELYPQYEFDVDENLIKFRGNDNEAWMMMKPTPEEAARARKFFGDA